MVPGTKKFTSVMLLPIGVNSRSLAEGFEEVRAAGVDVPELDGRARRIGGGVRTHLGMPSCRGWRRRFPAASRR